MRKDYLKFMASVQKGLKDKIKKTVKMLSHHHIKYFFLIKKCKYLSYAKKRTCLSFFLLKIFEFYFCPGNYAPPVILLLYYLPFQHQCLKKQTGKFVASW